MEGHRCNFNRYCYKAPTPEEKKKLLESGIIECNNTEIYAYRNKSSMKIIEIPASNRCIGTRCKVNSDCGEDAPVCIGNMTGNTTSNITANITRCMKI